MQLAMASLKPSSQAEYKGALNAFLKFCARKHIAIHDWNDVDYSLCKYMVYTYQKHGGLIGRQKCSKARSALLFFCPELSQKLLLSNKSLRGWEKLAPSQQYVPFPFELAMGTAYQLFRRGKVAMAVGMILQFDAYLRVGELIALRKRQIIFHAHPTNNEYGTLILPATKAGENQSVTFRGRFLHALLRRLTAQLQNDDRLFAFSEDTFRRQITITLKILKCYFFTVSSHGLRHGGSTYDAERGIPFEQIKIRGRWRRDQTVFHYLQQGVVAEIRKKIPPVTRRRLNRLTSNLSYYFNIDDLTDGAEG